MAVAAGLVILLAVSWKRLSGGTRRLAIYCVLLAALVAPLFTFAGHFAFYYSYMQFVPLSVALLTVYSELASADVNLRPALRGVFATTLIAAIAVGLPLQLALTASTANVAPREDIQRIVRGAIRPDDVVFSDYAYFFEVKRAARAVYDRFCAPALLLSVVPGGRDLTAAQKQSVSVLVIRPAEKEMITGYFGGHWDAVSAPFGDTFEPGFLRRLPLVGNRIIRHLSHWQTERCQFQVFRRLLDSPRAAPGQVAPAS